jgi:putative ATPase
MKAEGYAEGYRYPHDFPGHVVAQQYLPEQLAGRRYYDPSDEGHERDIQRRLRAWRKEPPEE